MCLRFFVGSSFLVCASLFAASSRTRAQDNYEIQVYSYDTVAPHRTMVELHSNYSSEHQTHLTLEITHGFFNR